MMRAFQFWADLPVRRKAGVVAAGFYLSLVVLLLLLLPWLPLPFAPNFLDLSNPYAEPGFLTEAGQSKHLLGTDAVGRDVLANVLFGFRTGFLVALPVMLFSVIAGTFLGSLAGYYGNHKLKISRAGALVFAVGLLLLFFYAFYMNRFDWQAALGGNALEFWELFYKSFGSLLIVGGFCWVLYRLLKIVSFFREKVNVPADEILLKTMEFLGTVPRLILFLCLAAFLLPGFGSVLLLLCLTFWVGPARLARTETLRIKKLLYTEAAQVAGLPDRRIIFRHILPNALAPLITAFCFGLGNLLGLESGLAFLGIGLPPETPSWGRLLAGLRLNPDAWWLLLFPGLALWFTILAIQICGDFLKNVVAKR